MRIAPRRTAIESDKLRSATLAPFREFDYSPRDFLIGGIFSIFDAKGWPGQLKGDAHDQSGLRIE
jgi:hypothetical protein